MDPVEYDEARWPTRALQQEEEEDACATAEADITPPTIQWMSASITGPGLLVVAASPASSALLRSAVGPDAQAVGHVMAASPAPPAAAGAGDTATQRPDPAVLYAPVPGVLMCCCAGSVAPQRAPAWARGLLDAVQPARLLVLGSMQAEQYRGEADASQGLLAFTLQTTAARQQQQQQQPCAPYLPSGSITSGLQAALLSQAELRALPAQLLVVVEAVPSLVPETLGALASLIRGAAAAQAAAVGGSGGAGDGGGGGAAWVDRLAAPDVVAAARLQLTRTSYRPSSVYA